MKNLKKAWEIMLFGMACFMYGVYYTTAVKFDVPIEKYRWVLTGLCGLLFFMRVYSHMREKS